MVVCLLVAGGGNAKVDILGKAKLLLIRFIRNLAIVKLHSERRRPPHHYRRLRKSTNKFEVLLVAKEILLNLPEKSSSSDDTPVFWGRPKRGFRRSKLQREPKSNAH